MELDASSAGGRASIGPRRERHRRPCTGQRVRAGGATGPPCFGLVRSTAGFAAAWLTAAALCVVAGATVLIAAVCSQGEDVG